MIQDNEFINMLLSIKQNLVDNRYDLSHLNHKLVIDQIFYQYNLNVYLYNYLFIKENHYENLNHLVLTTDEINQILKNWYKDIQINFSDLSSIRKTLRKDFGEFGECGSYFSKTYSIRNGIIYLLISIILFFVIKINSN